MKTTIVIRRDLYERAEKFARNRKISTDRLFSKAVKEYMDRRKVYDDEKITESFNKVYSEVESSIDPVVLRMALMSLPKMNGNFNKNKSNIGFCTKLIKTPEC